MSKKENRKKRHSIKKGRELKSRARLFERLVDVDALSTPRLTSLPDDEKMPRVEGRLVDLEIPKHAKIESSDSNYHLRVSWCARKADVEGSWSWGDREWSDEEGRVIFNKMCNFENGYWREICNQSSEAGHLMHHYHEITDLSDEVVARWMELDYEQFDTIFRFRLGSIKRAWGIVLGAHFFLIWWDPEHNFYAVETK